MTTIQNIISNYKENLARLNSSRTNFEIVINSDWDTIDNDLRIIYCGDNPGKKEKEENKYFVGASGKELQSFVTIHNKRLGINNNEFVFFNKTPFYSDRTTYITKDMDSDKLIYTSIKMTVNCLYEIWDAIKIPIVILGINEQSYIVKTFKEIIVSDKKYSTFLADLTILNHPSHNSLSAAFGKFLLDNFNNQEEVNNLKYTDLINGVKKNWL